MENTYFNLLQTIRNDAEQSAAEEPMLASFLHMTVLRHDSLERVLAFHLSSKLAIRPWICARCTNSTCTR